MPDSGSQVHSRGASLARRKGITGLHGSKDPSGPMYCTWNPGTQEQISREAGRHDQERNYWPGPHALLLNLNPGPTHTWGPFRHGYNQGRSSYLQLGWGERTIKKPGLSYTRVLFPSLTTKLEVGPVRQLSL